MGEGEYIKYNEFLRKWKKCKENEKFGICRTKQSKIDKKKHKWLKTEGKYKYIQIWIEFSLCSFMVLFNSILWHSQEARNSL
jgi:hypothetical protein